MFEHIWKTQKKTLENNYEELGLKQCPICEQWVREEQWCEIKCLRCDHLTIDIQNNPQSLDE